jgi:hypothetical protein
MQVTTLISVLVVVLYTIFVNCIQFIVQCMYRLIQDFGTRTNTVKLLSIVFQGTGKFERYIREMIVPGNH